MTVYFNATNTPIPEQRRAAIEACILAAIRESKRALRDDEIRRFVMAQPGFTDIRIDAVTEAMKRLKRAKRVVMIWQSMRTIPSYGLPVDPESPFVPHALNAVFAESIERRVLRSMTWPPMFSI